MEKSARSEARELFDRISALDPSLPEARRQARVDALAALQLREPDLGAVRDVCLTAHRGLLVAEREQAGAKRALAEAEVRKTQGQALSAEEGARITAAIERSNHALAEAQEALPRCEAESRELAMRAR